MDLAPIALFTYKRLSSLTDTIHSLANNPESRLSDLTIFSDGPKSTTDKSAIEAVRTYLKSVTGFKNVRIIESETNKGLANSIISGITQMFVNTDRVIVLEDDLKLSKNFLAFMNSSLEKFANDPNIFSISGYSFNSPKVFRSYKEDGYFLTRGWSWGWGTWKDRWNNIDWNISDYQNFKQNGFQKKEFSKGGSDLVPMLTKQMEGKIDSWAVRWFYHQFKVRGLTFYSNKSKVLNIGFDRFATHTTGSPTRFNSRLDDEEVFKFAFPVEVKVNAEMQGVLQKKMSVTQRVKYRILSQLIRAKRFFING